MMKKKSIVAVALAVVIAVVAVLVHRTAFARETTSYRFTAVERGDVESTVSATGTLSAVTTVAVGTQVSGQISELFVDFENIFDKSYRGISWGIDGAGRGVTLRYRYEF